MATPKHPSAVLRFVESMEAKGCLAFTLPELQAQTGLSEAKALSELQNLQPKVCRVPSVNHLVNSSEFFVIVPDEFQRYGVPPLDYWLDAYFKHIEQPYYIGLLSAAAVHGVPRPHNAQVQIMTDRPTHSLVLGALELQFFVKMNMSSTDVTQVPNAHGPLMVSTPRATYADLLTHENQTHGTEQARTNRAAIDIIAIIEAAESKQATHQ